LTTRGLSLKEGPHRSILHTLLVSQFLTPLGEQESDVFNQEGENKRPWLPLSATIEQALRSFDRTGLDKIAVVDLQNPDKIVGYALKVDALHHYNKALVDAHVEQNH